MTTVLTTNEHQLADRLRRMPGVRSVIRPVSETSGREFTLTYVREGKPGGTPLLILPGGPGLGSVMPYRSVRRAAKDQGFDVVMVEHRGVGLSRTDNHGDDLTFDAMTTGAVVDDLVAVLDDCGWRQVLVYGSSYGGYLAQILAARHPDRVNALVLDSPSCPGDDARDHLRRLFWHGAEPETADLAASLRSLVTQGKVHAAETGAVVPVAYEFGGTSLLRALFAAVDKGRTRAWNQLAGLGNKEIDQRYPYLMEADIAGAIYYREMHDVRPDGAPLDPYVRFAERADRFPAYIGAPTDLAGGLATFDRPTAVLSGRRDMRCVRPGLERLASSLPQGVLVPFPNSGHSFLDFHPRVALLAARAVANGRIRRLPELAPRLEALRKPLHRSLLSPTHVARVIAEAERMLPSSERKVT